MRTVTAGLIIRDGRFLICQRRADKAYALKWEFAGGKVEEGEDAAQCLRRELEEELAIDADVGAEVYTLPYQYPDATPILLRFFVVHTFRGEPRNLQFQEIRWVNREELPRFDFLKADQELIHKIAQGEIV